ncbi:MAG: hypothetical protein R3A52_12980 [Polyangiales bacterium]
MWAEIWPTIGPRIAHVLSTGEATWDEGLMLFLERSGYPEETYHTFSYSPVPGDAGEISGLFCVVIEETLRDRRAAHRSARPRGGPRGGGHDARGARRGARPPRGPTCARRDLRAHLPLRRRGPRVLAGASGIDRDHPAASASSTLARPAPPWPASRASEAATFVDLDPASPWPSGRWSRPPAQALVLPIASKSRSTPRASSWPGSTRYRLRRRRHALALTLLAGALRGAHARAGLRGGAPPRRGSPRSTAPRPRSSRT